MKEPKLRPVWRGMKARCYNIKTPKFKHYGGRGIKVCEEWRTSYKAFYTWAIANGYQDGLTLDRKDVNGNYEPSNCRWVSIVTQNRNRRNVRELSYNGETKTLFEWAEIVNIPQIILYRRIQDHGWSAEQALTTPVGHRRAR